jgi:hypothetical protein
MRFNKTGNTANARPCINCLKMMKDIGINKVYYSTGTEDGMVGEYVKNMISVQISSVTRQQHVNQCNSDQIELYENLIKDNFPKCINHYNLICFVKYNLKNVLPNSTYCINKNRVIINNKNKTLVIASIQ